MTKKEFIAQCYALLEAKGHIEHNGELYYPESAILNLMEFVRSENAEEDLIEAEKMLDKISTAFNT